MLTTGERTLADAGFTDHVLDTRRRYQMAMRAHAVSMVEPPYRPQRDRIHERQPHINPDLGAEIFMLLADSRPQQLHEADSPD